jgi:hypothetical protein
MESRRNGSRSRFVCNTRNALASALVALALASCVETLGDQDLTVLAPDRVRLAQATGKASAAKSNAAAKAALPEQVRKRLLEECISEHGGPFRVDAASDAQCECYATNVVKALRTDELEFYLSYNVVPTLSGTRPENVKQACGIKLDPSGPRPRPLAPPPN